MDKETILDYVTKTPENTNRNVLGNMIDSYVRSNGGGGGNIGILYALNMEPAQTDPALPEGEWSNSAIPVATNPDAEMPMTYSEMVEFMNTHDVIFIHSESFEGIANMSYKAIEEAREWTTGVVETGNEKILEATVSFNGGFVASPCGVLFVGEGGPK